MSKTTILLSALCVALVLYIVLRESNAKKNALGQQSEKPKSVIVRPKTVRPKTSTSRGQKLGFSISDWLDDNQDAINEAIAAQSHTAAAVAPMPNAPTGPNLKGSCSS